MTNEEAEIQRIEHELDILRARSALLEKWGRITKNFYLVAVPAAAILLLFLIAREYNNDILLGLFVAGMMFAVVGLIWIGARAWQPSNAYPFDRLSIFSIVSSQIRPAGLVPLYKIYSRPSSEALEIKEMIAAREKRLAELKKAQP